MSNPRLPFDIKTVPLHDLVRHAWQEGQRIDLEGIGYGRIHWGNASDVIDFPLPYYRFLAGLVRSLNFTRIFEIGTHWGGATRAMWHGVSDKDAACVVTVDITTESDSRLHAYPDIKKVVGDANTEEAFEETIAHFGTQPIDLLYIDADHFMMPLLLNFSLYTTILRPKFVVMDDVTWSDSMLKAWNVMARHFPHEDIINAPSVDRAIRPEPDNPGFGVVRLRQNF